MSDDGQLAVSVELQSEETARYALWDLTDGKLVRYLAAEEGAGVKAYAGADDADFGVKTVFSQRGCDELSLLPVEA